MGSRLLIVFYSHSLFSNDMEIASFVILLVVLVVASAVGHRFNDIFGLGVFSLMSVYTIATFLLFSISLVAIAITAPLLDLLWQNAGNELFVDVLLEMPRFVFMWGFGGLLNFLWRQFK